MVQVARVASVASILSVASVASCNCCYLQMLRIASVVTKIRGQAKKQTSSKVTSSLLELLVAAKTIINIVFLHAHL